MSVARLIKPQTPFFGIAGQYTNALYSAASKNKKLERVEEDLKLLRDTLAKDPRFREFLASPLVKRRDRNDVFDDVLPAKLKSCDLTVNVLKVLSENGRLKLLPIVIENYMTAMRENRGEITCAVTTAEPLTDPQVKSDLESTLKKFTNKKLEIQLKTDPSIIGGMIVDFGDKYVDMSMKSKLSTYTELLKEAV